MCFFSFLLQGRTNWLLFWLSIPRPRFVYSLKRCECISSEFEVSRSYFYVNCRVLIFTSSPPLLQDIAIKVFEVYIVATYICTIGYRHYWVIIHIYQTPTNMQHTKVCFSVFSNLSVVDCVIHHWKLRRGYLYLRYLVDRSLLMLRTARMHLSTEYILTHHILSHIHRISQG